MASVGLRQEGDEVKMCCTWVKRPAGFGTAGGQTLLLASALLLVMVPRCPAQTPTALPTESPVIRAAPLEPTAAANQSVLIEPFLERNSSPPAPSFSAERLTVMPERPKYPTVELGGVVHLDTGWFVQSDTNEAAVGTAHDGTSFRTARLWARGQLWEEIGYMLELDFGALASVAPGRPNFQNAYLEAQAVPWLGTVRVGRWKQPFSLETATSIRFLTFIERASLFAFVPFRRTGVGFFDASADERWTYAFSVFRGSDDGFGGSLSLDDRSLATAARLTHLLWYADDGSRLLHAGLAHTFNSAPQKTVRFARFGEFAVDQTPVGGAARGTPNQFDTGLLAAHYYNVFGAELAWVNGPISLQAEAMVNVVERIDQEPAKFTGWYVYVSWFLTGEHRRYLPQLGAFDRVQPASVLSVSRGGWLGSGAWELAARVSQVDVNGSGVGGGRLTSLTLGLNWYLTAHAKLQFNYIHNLRWAADDPGSRMDVFAVRVAYDF